MMDAQQVFTLGQQALLMLLMVAAPILIAVLVVGVLISVGIAVAKIVIPIALMVLLVNWFLRDRSTATAASALR